MKKAITRFLATLAIGVWFVAVLAITSAVTAGATPPEHVVICHAAGLEGTTQYVTLDLPWVAVYGVAGHFNENGTPRAGHEQDYIGACETQETTTTTTSPTSTSTVPESTTTTTPGRDSSTTTTSSPSTPGTKTPQSGSAGPTTPTPLASTPAGSLPFTGSSSLPLAILGLSLLASGAAAASRSDRRNRA